MQQTLPIVYPLKINKQTFYQLMQLVLIDNSFLICEWIPYKIFQQTTGIAMRTNCAVHFANFSLTAFEIHNKQTLNLYCPFMSRYIDNILIITVLSIPETFQLFSNFYKPLNLNLIPNIPKNNITIYLDIQLYTPQTNNKPLSFNLYRKLISSFPYPKPSSYSPPHIVKRLVITKALRISSRCSSPKNTVKEWHNFLYLLSLRRHNTDYINNILHRYIKNSHINPLERKSKKWHKDLIDYHIVTDFNSINYHLNNFAKTLDSKKKRISIRMHHSLGASLKQLTRFFDVKKNLSFSLENNNTINTYIHPNDRESVENQPTNQFPLLLITL
jgi:hypothetical protein